ncbi:2Fe-2S iron-sulfur cluster-binding protein [Streptomyces sp. NPDC127069]|uniref:2Fe-2S iron-sulfur cluster-binding protein n=1 Tax=Streptomyces sp. NPDC127069 TaxID=3347128 RepID=UPI003650E274
MSENENVSGTTGDTGNAGSMGNGGPDGAAAGAGWGWEPVPHGGDYDSDATAFVQLPQDMLDALDTGEPLAAPGHGFVPPPMIMPLGSSGSTDPSATGTWTMPAQWPEAGGAPAQAQAADTAAAAPARGPIPASIPLPASVAAAFAAAEPEAHAEFHGGARPEGAQGQAEAQAQPQSGFRLASHAGAHGTAQHAAQVQHGEHGEPAGQGEHAGHTGHAEHAGHAGHAGHVGHAEQQHAQHYADPHAGADPGATAEWQFPDALHREEEPAATGHWTLPADLTGGGAAAGAGAGAGVGAGAGGEVSGGTGEFRVGGPDAGWGQAPVTLPGGAPAPWAAPEVPAGPGAEDVAAAAETPLSSGVLPGGGAPGAHGAGVPGRGPRVLGGPGVGTPLPEGYPQAGPEPESVLEAAPDIEASHGHGPAQPPAGDERPRPAEAEAEGAGTEPEEGPAPAPAPGGAPGHGFAEGAAAPAGAEAAPAPGEDTADSAVPSPAGHDTGEFPLGEAAYEEERQPAVAHHEHPSASYVLRVNGADRPVTGAWIGESLLYVLRERLGLAGAKDGCSQGECGACAVQVDGRLVASCLVPAATAAGSEVRTVEGLARGGELSDVQQALCRSGGVQCGFCVPGMAMTIHDLLEGNHAPSDLETRQALCGNLCRCSGYKGVIEAVREVIAEREATAAQAAEGMAPEAPAEALIPHQAQPGEGGVHGFDAPAPGPDGTFGGNGFDVSGAFDTSGGFDPALPGPNGTLGGNGFEVAAGFDTAAPGPNGTLGGNGFDASGAFAPATAAGGFDTATGAGGFDAFDALDTTGALGIPGTPGATGGAAPAPHGFEGPHGPHGPGHGTPQGPHGTSSSGFDGIHHNGGMA